MEISSSKGFMLILLVFAFSMMQIQAVDTKTCNARRSPCFLKKVRCPPQCPSTSPSDPHAKVCFLNCDSPICQTECKNSKPNCNGPGSACLDPRFVGADGIVFYFHGKRNEHFSLVSDINLQINARFIGLRPAGRTRDYTWIQALGILSDSHAFSLEATTEATWDNETDHLKFSYNGQELAIPEGHLSAWKSPADNLRVERTSNKNSVIVTLPEVAEISVNVVPVTKEDSRIHNYQIPTDDCFAHLEVQFRFYGLSSKVEGVLGRTYQPDFENPAKPGVAMPVVGGDNMYRTTSLLSADCGVCIFSPAGALEQKESAVIEDRMLDCTGGANSGNGIVCRK
ncbi:Root cap/late embryogenesis-like protein [Quillaja saponaria]|uniref:Root cap/late embryogenesis-like protein n=1 Tax=Quillaja saponaria TaxID=32244 RepID=A0AAD7L0J1_QUISA|nr:Root cap/late embryogenesis-like protein [Quillaja saponaria]